MDSRETPSISAVVVSWNSAEDISTCLDSLLRQTYSLRSIVVVDNASSDSTPDLVAEKYPKVTLIRRETNEGFARGNNIGIAETDSDWVLTLNPDASPEEDYIQRLIEFAEERPRIGSMMGKLLRDGRFQGGEQVIDTTGIEIFRSRRVRDRSAGLPDDGSWEREERVFGVCAAAALYRMEMLRDISPDGEIFPSSFFTYYEDADLAWRAWRRGWEAWYVPQAVCLHKRGGSPIGSRFSRYHTHRNRYWLIARNEQLNRLLKNLPQFVAHEALTAFRMMRYPYLFKASFEALAGLPAAIRYRKTLPDKVVEPPPFKPGTGFDLGDIVKAVRRRNKPVK